MATQLNDNRASIPSKMIGLRLPLPDCAGERRDKDDRQPSGSAILEVKPAGWSLQIRIVSLCSNCKLIRGRRASHHQYAPNRFRKSGATSISQIPRQAGGPGQRIALTPEGGPN